jgi:YbgC/YbaW family acyl-CoA thioester hydrolase
MACEFKHTRIVEFAETDMAGILHFANFFRYMEAAEHAFFRSLGLRVHTHEEDGVFGWARGKAECTFRQPLRYEDEVEVHVIVREKCAKSIGYEFVFRKRDGEAMVEVARGALTAVCIGRTEDGRLKAMAMPAEVDAAIEVAPPNSS